MIIYFIFFALNIVCAIWNYNNKSYKTAMLSSFAAGWVLALAYKLL